VSSRFSTRNLPDPRQPSRAEDLLAGLFHSPAVKEKVRRVAALPKWESVVGPELAKISAPQKLLNGTVLFVEVLDPVWAQELTLRRDEFLRTLRERSPESFVEEIRFVAGDPRRFAQNA
jgi:predicted nucleic acid-binding Zn ribbon protein